MRLGRKRVSIFVAAAGAALAVFPGFAQAAMRAVTQAIDANASVVLAGNTRPEARPINDRGRVNDDFRLDHLQLLLKRPPAREAALVRLIDQLHDPKSPYFHQWLTAAEFGAQFGPDQADITRVTAWLGAHGFMVNSVLTSGMTIDFSGNAGQVRGSFGTEIHHLLVNGVAHFANMSNPRIPVSLAGVVRGIVSLHDFRPHTNFKPRADYSVVMGGVSEHMVVPADLATIYNFNPLFAAGITGKGQTITVIEDSDLYNAADWSSFRTALGLAVYSDGALRQIHPNPALGGHNCDDPGVIPEDENEAALDAEWASAAAPDATIELAACASERANFGGLIALQNLINSASPPAIISISYGECETENGAGANAAFSAIYQQAVAQGSSIYVSSGDEGAASCDAFAQDASHGIGISAFASTAYNVAVGGTDFADTLEGTTAKYWSSTNSADYGSALSYIPEIPWNDSCAEQMTASHWNYPTTYGTGGFCNSALGRAYFLTTVAGSGGPSMCASGAPATAGVVSGTCQGAPKPSWQVVYGNPNDGVRDIPDISMFAANGLWQHFYVYCESNRQNGGRACNGAPSSWSGGGGTSYAAPVMAGVQALINQKMGARQGNPNPVLYRLAAAEYGANGNAACGTAGTNAGGCIFHDIVQGNIDVNCRGSYDCYLPGGTNGVLSAVSARNSPVYGTSSGWDFATGIGSVNVNNLVQHW